jgi:hypothetical protein
LENLKCFHCGNSTVWAGENRYLCESGCTSFGPHKEVFKMVVDKCRETFKREADNDCRV